MTPFQIHARIRRHAMGLLRLHVLTASDLAILQAMLDHACPRAALAFTTTYDWLQRITGRSRQAVADAVRRLDACRLVLRFRDGHVVRRRWRQKPNRYVFNLSESAARTDSLGTKNSSYRRAAQRRCEPNKDGIEGKRPAVWERIAAQTALAEIAARRLKALGLA